MARKPRLITEHDTKESARAFAKHVLEEHQPSQFDPVTGREVHPAYQPRCTGCTQSQWPCTQARLALAVIALTGGA